MKKRIWRNKEYGINKGIFGFWVKPVPVAMKMMPDAEMEPPYDGAKKMLLLR